MDRSTKQKISKETQTLKDTMGQSDIIDFFFKLLCDLLVIQQHVVQPPYVGIFNSFSPLIDIYSYCIVVRKAAWSDFNFFDFTKARFISQDVIYPGEGSVCV